MAIEPIRHHARVREAVQRLESLPEDPDAASATLDGVTELLREYVAAEEQALQGSFFHRVAPLVYLLLITALEVIFIDLYCRWHGAHFFTWPPWDIYADANIQALVSIDYVRPAGDVDGPPTPMSLIAEVLMWSSLGVWAQRSFEMVARYERQRLAPAHDMAVYGGILVRRTTVAAIVIVLLNISSFSAFDLSIQEFEVTAAIAFILGVFGDDAYDLLVYFRDRTIGTLLQRKDS